MKPLALLLLVPLLFAGCSSNKSNSTFQNGTWNESRPAEKFTFGNVAKPKPKEALKEKSK